MGSFPCCRREWLTGTPFPDRTVPALALGFVESWRSASMYGCLRCAWDRNRMAALALKLFVHVGRQLLPRAHQAMA